MPTDPIALTRELVAIESPTYHEAAVGRFLYERLSRTGWQVTTMPVPQGDPHTTPGAGIQERFNLYALPQQASGKDPALVFSTHIDTVPPYIPLHEDAEHLYGRGTCDAKGIVAAQIAAAERLREQGQSVGLLFVVGEERDSAGALVANARPRSSRFLINGEPTGNRLAIASKGALRVELRARGRMAHSAYPELGDSAIHKLVAALNDVLALDLPCAPDLGADGATDLNIGLLQGGHAPNVIADRAEAHLLVRLIGPSNGIREAIARAVAGRAEVTFSLDLPFVRMRPIESLPTMVAKFTTDIPSLTNWGEPFLLGPGSIHVAHTPDEKISKRELVDGVDCYVDLASKLLSSQR